MMADCLPVCGNGMYSQTGMIPCQLCPRHTFSGPPILGGYLRCETCPEGTFSSGLGSTGPPQCQRPCQSGHFSVTGLHPCSPCPINFYQPNVGQQRCIECLNDTFMARPGATTVENCQQVDCSTIECEHNGVCEVVNHAIQCKCMPGFTGVLCDQNLDSCGSSPCFNNARCEDRAEGFHCICAQNYTGSHCQFGPDECIGVHCPNGGVCQDLPGLQTTKCLCRTGFTGPSCSQLVNPCVSDNPCKNGADCQPRKLGRFKCVCLPGWKGSTCEENIDDCAEKPCAMNATCTDLVNDFSCDCPPGFSGKRCHTKQDLCSQDPCVHGICVDRLFSQTCLCEPGWSGEYCENNIDECASDPCENGATCRDDINTFVCQCTPGYYGSLCQHPIDHCGSSPCRNDATCINRGATYRCICKLGYEDACIDYCLNDSVCKKNPVGYVECECKEHFNGERCEIRFQPKTQKIAYIAGGIGGIVAILILIVIIVWMICFRFSSKPEESELNNDKSPVPAETASDHGLGSDNFMYGRPTPVGAPANNRSIGYYYEDEDEYDMKTMYINDGYDGGPADKASTAGGSQANKEEMFERLCRMNQHMYRPKQGSSESGQSEHEADEARTAH